MLCKEWRPWVWSWVAKIKVLYGLQRLTLHINIHVYEPGQKKTSLQDFRPGRTQTGLYSLRWSPGARNFRFKKWRNWTIYVVKTKGMICCAITAQLISAFVFTYMQKAGFFHAVAHIHIIWHVVLIFWQFDCCIKQTNLLCQMLSNN